MEDKFLKEANNTASNYPSDKLTMQGDIYEQFNKILLIEDNPGDARLVELLLGESDLLNCKIINKTTLTQGLELLAEGDNFAAILLDLSLPDSRGFETLQKLLGRFPDNNVIVLTGLSDKSMGVKAVKAGAQDYLIKGAFDADSLAKALRYSIERSSVLKRLEDSQRIAHIGNWEYNSNTKELSASDEIYRIFGFPVREIIISPDLIENPIHPFSAFKEIHDEAIKEKWVKKDMQIRQKNGETRFISVECRGIRKGPGSFILTGIMQDITERKLAEKELIKSQDRYQDIFTKSKDAIYICTLDGKFVDFNQATVRLFGHMEEELKKMDAHQFFQSLEVRKQFLEQLNAKKAISDLEVIFNCNGDVKRYCLISAGILETDDFTGYNCVVRDITERKQAEELIKARDLARESASMKEQFIASISHEMRTPMNAILGMSNLVIKTDLDTEQFNYISSIKKSSEILLGIVNDILEISTLQNGKVEFEYKTFDIHELLTNLINIMQYKATEKEMFIELVMEPAIPRFVKGDQLRINQILYNLVGNAVKFTDNGFVKVFVKILSENNNTVQIKFEVQDTGIGIPKEKLEAIFETFTRVRSKDRIYEGTGLGLSIAKNLVEQQGGKIGVDSKVGYGSTFFFDLVLEKGSEEELKSDEKQLEEDIELKLNRPLQLLLVEDHKMNQLVARKTLERHWTDIDLTIANHGKEGIEQLEKRKFDIVLMDIQMPIMDGYEATKYIREQMPPEIANMPILAMTAHAHISKDEKFKEYGMDDFVLKPFEPKQLFAKIAKYVNKNLK